VRRQKRSGDGALDCWLPFDITLIEYLQELFGVAGRAKRRRRFGLLGPTIDITLIEYLQELLECAGRAKRRRRFGLLGPTIRHQHSSNIFRNFWSAPAERSGDGALDCWDLPFDIILIEYLQLIYFETVNRLHLCRPGSALKPSR